ncbi:MAG TPA: site-specific DNA-methyltransferase [Paludibacteraceae bacterium]|nr:site-specific DNA-methyltransferase [Paludibacteraceae bacterium]
MPHERLKPSFTFDKDRLEELKKIAPEAFADGQINWDTLKEALGEYLEDDGPDAEHFGLFWPGKRQARKMASIPSKGTLVPVYGEGLKADGTPDTDGHNDSHNIFIEGENLEVLKILQKSYAGRIKMIYIDPPYNTGNDFVYEDDFKEPLQEYLRRTGQVDEEGRPLTTNTRADGRFHSKWLSMMYPRLRLARNLLRDDGVIFVSIDDNEVHHQRCLLNEIMGEENYESNIIPVVNPGGRDYKQIAVTHEYILVFSKSDITEFNELPKETDFQFNDSNGGYNLRELRNRNPKFHSGNRPNLFYPFYVNPNNCINGYCSVSVLKDNEHNIEVWPYNSEGKESVWRWSKEKASKNIIISNIDKSQIVAKQKSDGNWNIYEKNRRDSTKAKSIWDETVMRTENGTRSFRELFNASLFDHPKSVDLIKRCIQIGSSTNDIILDFFSGTATTAQAVLELNQEDGGNRKFILVQMPEPCNEKSEAYKAGFKNIAEIGKERIRRVVKKLKEEQPEKKKQDKLEFEEDDAPSLEMDYGFKVLKLQPSHYKPWQNYEGTDYKELELKFEEFTTPLVDGWKEDNLLTEIILMEGFPLDSSIEEVKTIKTNTIKQVTSGFHEHRLLVCLDKKIAPETINELKLTGDDVFICLDSAITDEDKVHLSDKGMIKTI